MKNIRDSIDDRLHYMYAHNFERLINSRASRIVYPVDQFMWYYLIVQISLTKITKETLKNQISLVSL